MSRWRLVVHTIRVWTSTGKGTDDDLSFEATSPHVLGAGVTNGMTGKERKAI